MPKKIKADSLPASIGTLYPPPHHTHSKSRIKRALGNAFGLDQFGVNQTVLPPGTWSALPHWHTTEDELVYVLSGTATLVSGDHTEDMGPGDCVGFKAGEEIGHCIQNNSDADVVILEIGSRNPQEKAYFPGRDMMADFSAETLFRKLDGSSMGPLTRRGPDDD
ncbi:MAG: cupin domain-containing protein [Thalassovita sp.]